MSKDSIDRLIDYAQTIKPYHTKIVEVLTNYTYQEDVSTKILDKLEVLSVPCECDPNMIHMNVGWDTQPFGQFDWVLLGTVDERGNFLYGVTETNPENTYWNYPIEPPEGDEDDCCTVCDVWLCEGVGWDTSPFGLYEALDTGTVDADGLPIYKTAISDLNTEFDSPNECPDAEEEE